MRKLLRALLIVVIGQDRSIEQEKQLKHGSLILSLADRIGLLSDKVTAPSPALAFTSPPAREADPRNPLNAARNPVHPATHIGEFDERKQQGRNPERVDSC